MLFWILSVLLIAVLKCRCQTPYHLVHINEMDNLAQFHDAQHRGPIWYDYSEHSGMSTSYLATEETSSIALSSESVSNEDTSTGSSKDTKEKHRVTRMYRSCTACPHDMLKKYSNIGIKWICGGYQRARRSFKSECMMRYRNCQDGTMFVKLYDYRCRNDSYHGRSWFYQYKV